MYPLPAICELQGLSHLLFISSTYSTHSQHYLPQINPHNPKNDLTSFLKLSSKTQAKQIFSLSVKYRKQDNAK